MNEMLKKYFAAIKEFLPEKISKPSIGLDIGTGACKAVEVVQREDVFEITNWGIEPIIAGDPLTTTKKLLGKFDIQTKNVTTAVSGKGILIRFIDMPRMPIGDLRNSINIEADKHFPFAKDQIYTDCSILDSSNKDSKMHVLVAAAKKEVIEARKRLLLGLGLKSEFIGTNSIAIANVFSLSKGTAKVQAKADSSLMKEQAQAILDIGHSASNLVVFRENLPYFIRDIFIGGQNLDKRISNVLAVDIKEAERIKRQPQDKTEEVKRACESILMNLVSELRLSFDYYATEKNITIPKLFLTGGSSMLQDIVEFFTQHLDMSVELWNPLQSYNCSAHLDNSGIDKWMNQLGVALGLALYHHD